MTSARSKQKILKDHKALLRNRERAKDTLQKDNFLHNWRQRQLTRKTDEKLFKATLAQAGIDMDSYLEQQASHRKAAEEFRSRQRQVIAKNVTETEARQRALRKDMSRRHKLLKKLSGHSPQLGCSVLADDQYRRSLPRTGRGTYDIDEARESHRRRTLDNAGDLGGRVRTGPRGWARMRHRLFNEFTWMSDEDGILEAQGYMQVNGEYELSTVWGWLRNSATVRLTASLTVTQGGTTTRSAPYPILNLFEEGGRGAGWWGSSRNGFIDADEIVLEPPAMEIVRDDWVQFTFEIEGYIEADDGAEATLNIADGPREVNMPGVTFRVS